MSAVKRRSLFVAPPPKLVLIKATNVRAPRRKQPIPVRLPLIVKAKVASHADHH
jgi:hypothetical protein